MSTIIDNNVVSLTFDNSKFEKAVKTTLNTLSRLKTALTFDSFDKGLESVGTAADTVKVKIGALETFTLTAMTRMSNAVINYGKNLVKSLSTDQISAGFEKYAEKTTGVQTIMAATGKSIDEVSDSLDKLNWFTDETSYRFTDMITNIGKFTSQGIDLDTAVSAMEGISTWASVSGQGVNEASRAMYNLAQAIGVGSVKLMDWKSIENANMATREFKQQAIDAALAYGTLAEKVDKDGNTVYYAVDKMSGKMTKTQVTLENFSQTLSEGWFSSDVLLDVLNDYGAYADQLYALQSYVADGVAKTTSEMIEDIDSITESTTDAELVQMGYTEDAIDLLREMANMESKVAKKSFKAAQEAKTFAEAIDSVREAVASKWMGTFENIFGNYEEAKKLWTDLANDLYDVFAESGNERNEILAEWKVLVEGGRDDLIDAFQSIFHFVTDIWSVVKDVFHSIFPKKTAEDLAEIVLQLKEFADNLTLDSEAFDLFFGTLQNIFSVAKTLGRVAKSVFSGFKKGLQGASSFALSLLDSLWSITAAIDDILWGLTRTSSVFNLAKSFGNLVSTIASKLKELYSIIREIFGRVFKGDAYEEATNFVDVGKKMASVLDKLTGSIGKFSAKIATIDFDFVIDPVIKLASKIKDLYDTVIKYAPIIWKALTGEAYSSQDLFTEGWEENGTVLERFAKRLVALSDAFNYYWVNMLDAEHKGAFVLNSLKSLFSSVAWTISGASDDISASVSGMAKAFAAKVNIKMYDIFGEYWTWLKNSILTPVEKVFESLHKIITSVGKALNNVFNTKLNESALTFGGIINKILGWIGGFVDILYVTDERADKLERTFRGLFSILDIGKQILASIFGALPGDIAVGGSFVDVILSITSAIGDWLYELDQVIRGEASFDSVFSSLFNLFDELKRVAKESFSFVKQIFLTIAGIEETGDDAGKSTDKVAKGITSIGDALAWVAKKLKAVDIKANLDLAVKAGNKIREVADKVKNGLMMAGGFIIGIPAIVNQVFSDIQAFVNEKTTKMKAKFNELWASVKQVFGTVWDDAVAKFEEFKAKLKPVVDPIIDRFNKLKESFSNLKKAIKSLGFDFGGLFDAFKKGKDSVGDTKEIEKKSIFDKIADWLIEFKPKLDKFYEDTLKPMAATLGEFLGQLKDTFKELFKDVTLGDVVKWILEGSFVAALFGLKSAIDGISESIEGFTGGGPMSAFESFCKALLMLAAGLFLLSKIPDDELARAMSTMFAMSIVLTGTLIAMTAILKTLAEAQVNAGQIKQMRKVLTTFGLATLMIAVALAKLAKYDFNSLARAVAAVAVMYGMMALIIKFVSKNFKDKELTDSVSKFEKLTKTLLISGAVIGLLGILYKHVDTGALEKLGIAMAAFEAALFAFAGIVLLIDKTKLTESAMRTFAAILVGMVLGIGMIAAVSYAFTEISQEALNKTVIALGAFELALTAFIGIVALLDKAKIDKSTMTNFVLILSGLVVGGAAMAGLSYIFQNISTEGITNMSMALAALSGGILAFSLIVALLNKAKITKDTIANFGILLGAMSVSLLAIAGVSKIFDFVSWDSIDKSAKSLLVFLSLLVGSVLIFKVAGIDKKVVESFAIALGAMTIAFAGIAAIGLILDKVDVGKLIKSAAAMAIFIATLIAALVAIKVAKIDFATVGVLAVAIISLAASFGIMAAAIYMITTALVTLANTIQMSPETVKMAFDMIRETITTFFTAIVEIFVGAIAGILAGLANGFINIITILSDNAALIMESVANLLIALFNALESVLPSFFDLLTTFMISLLDMLTNVTPHFLEWIKVLLSGILDVIIAVIPKLFIILQIIITGALELLTASIPLVVDVIKILVDAVVELVPYIANKMVDLLISVIDLIGDRLPEIVDELFKMVRKLIVGVAEAIYNNAEDLGEAVAYGLSALLAAAIKTLTGMINGTARGGELIKEAASELGSTICEKIFGGLGDTISGLIDGVSGIASDVAEGASNLWDGVKGAVSDGWGNVKGFFHSFGYSAGEEAGDGLKEGARESLDEHSPSKEMSKIGEFAGEGLVNGLKEKLAAVKNAGSNLGETALSSLSEKLGDASILDGLGFDLNPTITPTIDLSEFSSGIGDMNSMLSDVEDNSLFETDSSILAGFNSGSGDAASISSLFSGGKSGQNGSEEDADASASGTTINLTQNNYSPEALSRTDIYRQTKNLLSTMQQAWDFG